MFGDQLFITKEFKYFFSVLENIINDRRESKRVGRFILLNRRDTHFLLPNNPGVLRLHRAD